MYNELIKTIYEMEKAVVTETCANWSTPGSVKRIGRIEEYDKGIEIMFEDDTEIWINKENVQTISCNNSQAAISFSNGDLICFERTI